MVGYEAAKLYDVMSLQFASPPTLQLSKVSFRSIHCQLDGKIESRSILGFLMTLVEAQLRHWRIGVLINPAAPLQVIFIANDEWWVTRRRICWAMYVANRLSTHPAVLACFNPCNPI
jgi:hypothetical protein